MINVKYNTTCVRALSRGRRRRRTATIEDCNNYHCSAVVISCITSKNAVKRGRTDEIGLPR